MNTAGTHWTQIALDSRDTPYVVYADRTTITGDTPDPSVVGQSVTVSFTVTGAPGADSSLPPRR